MNKENLFSVFFDNLFVFSHSKSANVVKNLVEKKNYNREEEDKDNLVTKLDSVENVKESDKNIRTVLGSSSSFSLRVTDHHHHHYNAPSLSIYIHI